MPFTEVQFWVRFTFTAAALGGFTMTLAYLLMCSPISLFWQTWDGHSVPGGHCGNLKEYYFWTGFLKSLSGFSIVVLPMPWLYSKFS